MTGVFAAMQKNYAKHGVATYPLTENKVPAITNFQRVGLKASRALAEKFADADALGFVAGRPNRLTIVDIDSPDDALVREVQERFGQTPLQVITPSRGRHLYYKYVDERRFIRPLPNVDILGAGPVVGIGSRDARGDYEIERGSFDDLARLPPITRPFYADCPGLRGGVVEEGQRNNELFMHCMREAPRCNSLDDLLDVARTHNEEMMNPPLADAEVVKAAQSAWGYERRGENRVGQLGVWFPNREWNALWAHQDALLLLIQLRGRNKPDATFWIADGFARVLDWDLRRLRAARADLVSLGYIAVVQPPRRGRPALYRWTGRIASAPDGS